MNSSNDSDIIRSVYFNDEIPKGWKWLELEEARGLKNIINNLLNNDPWFIIALKDGKLEGSGYGNNFGTSYESGCGYKIIIRCPKVKTKTYKLRNVEINTNPPKGWRVLELIEAIGLRTEINNLFGNFPYYICSFKEGCLEGTGFGNNFSLSLLKDCGQKIITQCITVFEPKGKFNKNQIFKENIASIKTSRQKVLNDGQLTIDGHTMKFCYNIKGDKPNEGFPLIIGLHGGGGCCVETNNCQYENHKNMYPLHNCIWFTPRSPEDVWNMWHLSYIDEMLDYIIQSFIILEMVDPLRIFLSGYSAGGDGVYKLGPRMADRFAGCAMMAGHPGGVDLISVRNTFFSLQIGENDTPYDRNQLCIEYGEKLKELQNKDPSGYDHHVKVHEGCGHWMDTQDKIVFDMFNSKIRNFCPSYVIWRQCSDVVKNSFYWLEIPSNQLKNGATIEATIENNIVEVITNDYDEVIINLHDYLIDFEDVIGFKFNNSEIFEIKIEENLECILESIRKKYDPCLIYGNKIKLSAKGLSKV